MKIIGKLIVYMYLIPDPFPDPPKSSPHVTDCWLNEIKIQRIMMVFGDDFTWDAFIRERNPRHEAAKEIIPKHIINQESISWLDRPDYSSSWSLGLDGVLRGRGSITYYEKRSSCSSPSPHPPAPFDPPPLMPAPCQVASVIKFIDMRPMRGDEEGCYKLDRWAV